MVIIDYICEKFGWNMVSAEIVTRKIGNSCGVILPAFILEKMGALEPGSKLFVSVNDEGVATLELKVDGSSFIGPFKALERYSAAWEDGLDAVESATALESSRNNKEFEEW